MRETSWIVLGSCGTVGDVFPTLREASQRFWGCIFVSGEYVALSCRTLNLQDNRQCAFCPVKQFNHARTHPSAADLLHLAMSVSNLTSLGSPFVGPSSWGALLKISLQYLSEMGFVKNLS